MEKWIANVAGLMHVHKITQSELANKLGLKREYVNRILNGAETPANAKERIIKALNEIIESKS